VREFAGDLTDAIVAEWSVSAEPPRKAPAVQHRQLTDGGRAEQRHIRIDEAENSVDRHRRDRRQHLGDHVHLAQQAVDQLRAVAAVDQQLLRANQWARRRGSSDSRTAWSRPRRRRPGRRRCDRCSPCDREFAGRARPGRPGTAPRDSAPLLPRHRHPFSTHARAPARRGWRGARRPQRDDAPSSASPGSRACARARDGH
jgi:hypothetical protein